MSEQTAPWSQEKRDAFFADHLSMSTRELGIKYSLSKRTARRWVVRIRADHGLGQRETEQDPRRAIAYDLFKNQGMRRAEIARKLGANYATTTGWINKELAARGEYIPREKAAWRQSKRADQFSVNHANSLNQKIAAGTMGTKFTKLPPCKMPPAIHGPGVEFFDLESGMCRWPLGGVEEDTKLFCGGKCDGGSYCADHKFISQFGYAEYLRAQNAMRAAA
jgi:hypothetical protein